jgi:hypothetical protein
MSLQHRAPSRHLLNERASQHRIHPALVLFPLVLVVTIGCGPGGPSHAELVNEPAFAATMPGASEQDSGGANSNTGLNAHTSYAWRSLATVEDQDDVVAWHSAAYEADGWTPISWPYVTMSNGTFAQHAWRRGDLVIGLGFKRPVGGYEITITYHPDRRAEERWPDTT